ncbi:MAG: SpoIID/LytB domain-containing protein [Negativicutes bacterium]|nr:SpoIID/LytB domain-containing protein [Negativicutes bacterium]
MRKYQYFYAALMVAALVIVVAGVFAVLRPPALKPVPEVPLAPGGQMPQPIPGVPLFDAGKYKTEPMVSVWLADRGYVENMPLEHYLEGVVAQEMDVGWPQEALRAQAIASRTLTISASEAGAIRHRHGADVSTAKDELQAYAPEKVNENVRQAVRSTRGQILLYAGSLVNAIYSASNGQIAATKEEAFPREIPQPTPYFQPVTDNSFRYTPAQIQSWSVSIPAQEVAATVGYSGNPGDIAILEKGPSGRILSIGAGDKKMTGADFRKAVGYDRLWSTLITSMTYDGGQFTFQGSGWGNGVGLCQWGAYAYARDGLKAEDILRHYYVGAEIRKLWE